MIEVSDNSIRIALLQGYDQGSKDANLAYTIARIREAALGGAKIICTQELLTCLIFVRFKTRKILIWLSPYLAQQQIG